MRTITKRCGERNLNLAAPTSQNVNDPAGGTGGFLPGRQVRERYGGERGISEMTLWRWIRDTELNFPQPIYFGRYRYWRIAELEAWEAEQEAKSDRRAG